MKRYWRSVRTIIGLHCRCAAQHLRTRAGHCFNYDVKKRSNKNKKRDKK